MTKQDVLCRRVQRTSSFAPTEGASRPRGVAMVTMTARITPMSSNASRRLVQRSSFGAATATASAQDGDATVTMTAVMAAMRFA